MASSTSLLNTSTTDLAMLTSQIPDSSLNSGRSNSADQVAAPPQITWIENLWALGSGRQAAIVSIDPGLPVIPAADLAVFNNSGVEIFNVVSQLANSYLLMGIDRWLVLDNGSWITLYTPGEYNEPSVFILEGITYMYAAGAPMKEFDPVLNKPNEFQSLLDVTLVGIVEATIVSACASGKYMILASADTIYYSAPLSNRHFTPGGTGAETGAGSAKVLSISSTILFVLGTEDGFHIYTDTNIVKATYSGDPDNPWIFTPVSNSTGVLAGYHILRKQNAATTFAWTSSGMAIIAQGSTKYLFPKLTELIAGDVQESYNGSTKLVELNNTGVIYDLKLSFIGNRLLCISYGPEGSVRDNILIYDTVLAEWSRLKIPHVAILAFAAITAGGTNFEDWLDNFEDTTDTFTDMLARDINPQLNTLAVGVLGIDGKLVRLSPIDIKTDFETLEFEVLSNVLVYAGLQLTRGSMGNLHKINLATGQPSYNSNTTLTTDTTAVYGYSDTDPVVRQFKLAPTVGKKKLEYVESIVGNECSVVLENINSLVGLEIEMIGLGSAF